MIVYPAAIAFLGVLALYLACGLRVENLVERILVDIFKYNVSHAAFCPYYHICTLHKIYEYGAEVYCS